jgi:malate synthase
LAKELHEEVKMAIGTAHYRSYDFEITRPYGGYEQVLSPEACAFLVRLHENFAGRVTDLLHARAERQVQLDRGELPDFLPETRWIRESNWRIGDIPQDLLDRRVEITGPVDRKMVINALNSGAKVYMADFEDAHSPTWEGTLAGQANLFDAVRRTIEYVSPEGKHYRLVSAPATLVVRPRGWHLVEKHVLVHGRPIPAALFDFGLYVFHNARYLLEHGTGPYFYLPKLEGHREARLWNEVFNSAQDTLGVPRGSIKATVLIETILAAFEMHEILYELREHIVGLNCGRWDYIFSFIKKFRRRPEFVLPNRAQLTMTTHFLHSYSRLVIQTCHRCGAHAMGGMAAQIPVKDDPEANAQALAKVRADKEREARDGHDGTWVAHPALVSVALEVFDEHMPGPHQIDRLLDGVSITRDDLLRVPPGSITEEGVCNNVSVALRYLAAWLEGRGAVPIYNLMEDAATAEIARAQLWQWIHHPGGVLDNGRRVSVEMFREMLSEELTRIQQEVGAGALDRGQATRAATLLRTLVENDRFEEFLTLPAYEQLP